MFDELAQRVAAIVIRNEDEAAVDWVDDMETEDDVMVALDDDLLLDLPAIDPFDPDPVATLVQHCTERSGPTGAWHDFGFATQTVKVLAGAEHHRER